MRKLILILSAIINVEVLMADNTSDTLRIMHQNTFPVIQSLLNNDSLTCAEKMELSKKYTQDLIGANIKYPELAAENGREGTVVIGLKFSKDGNISYEILHHFELGSEKAAKKAIDKSNILNMKWEFCNLKDNLFSFSYAIPITFSLNEKKPPLLWEIEQIFCERSEYFNTQRVKSSKLMRIINGATSINGMWFYRLQMAKFLYFNAFQLVDDNIINKLESVHDLKSLDFLDFINKVEKGSVIRFEIFETNGTNNQKIIKALLIE